MALCFSRYVCLSVYGYKKLHIQMDICDKCDVDLLVDIQWSLI